MIAIDTNLIIRYLTGDDSDQTVRARAIFNGNIVFVPFTVILEVERVLRSLYRLSRAERAKAIRDFSGLPSVTIEDAALVSETLDLFAMGMDLADALHLVRARHCETFVTFDRQFIKAAAAAGYQNLREA